jgi:hypothetical protein
MIDKSTRVGKMVDLFSGLPKANFVLLKYLLAFLSKVLALSEINKMGVANLATVINIRIAGGDRCSGIWPESASLERGIRKRRRHSPCPGHSFG